VTVYSIFGVPYLVLMPVFARDRLHMNASGYGLLLACVGIGGLMGALALAAQVGQHTGNKTMVMATYAFPVVLLVLSAVTSSTVAYVLLFIAGVAMIVNSAVTNSLLQYLVPDEMRGRVMAAYSFVVVGLSQTIGAFVAGLVARAFGVQWAIAIGSVLMLVYAIRALGRAPLKSLVTPGVSVP
jgi:MFS family permease